MATVIAGLAATAFTVGGTAVTYGGLLTAVALGASTYSALAAPAAGSTQVQKAGQITDRTQAQQAEQLDAAELGEDESEKRKRLSAKEKFKIEKDPDAVAETGVSIEADPTQVTGVQI